MSKTKSFQITKKEVGEAYKQVKRKKGAEGIDRQTIEEFEQELGNNLYKIWNRMSSGTWFPPPVKTVGIPKKDGGERRLGIPTVSDRIAQTVVKQRFEPLVDPYFHPDSYGYRPGKSANDAVGVTRERCWRYDWVGGLDIKGFFDNIDHELLLRAVRKHTSCAWMILYIERWLKAPAVLEDGTMMERTKGTPQGGVISPLLANLFLHYTFDEIMRRRYPTVPFARYADDVVIHCTSLRQARWLKAKLDERFAECKLELHPEKTKIVYCKDDNRRAAYPETSFDFLGYTFRARRAKGRKGKLFVSFSPAVSNKSAQFMRDKVRSWKMHLRSDKTIEDLSRMFNHKIRGWINYFKRYYRSSMYPIYRFIDRILVKWAMRKYKRFKNRQRRATHWLGRIAEKEPWLFAHWQMGIRPATGR